MVVNQGQSFLLAFKAFQERTYLGFTWKPRIPGFRGFPGVSMSCFSMKARNFHTWHSHSCLSWLFLGLVCMDKIHAFRESPEPSPGFPGFSWKNIPVFPRKPGISMLSWLFQGFQRPKKQGKAKKARVSRLFRGFRAFLGFFWQG